MKLEGQVAIVTGAGRNIGEDTAKLMASEGAEVAVGDMDRARGDRVAAEIVRAPSTRWPGQPSCALRRTARPAMTTWLVPPSAPHTGWASGRSDIASGGGA
jgi:NAD(P)-dependent dehydrogenase (short-subunit alcohol dehydrogenase family)